MGGDNFEEEDEWRPPTEAEMKVIQARRERSDKVSKIMGQYLLKGHKMLDTLCPVCSCILLQMNPSNRLHCVSCIDLDSEIKKDDPALNSEAASATVTEARHREAPSTSTTRSSMQLSTSAAVGISVDESDLANSSNMPPTLSNAVVERSSIQPTSVVKHEFEVEEHATPSGGLRAESENLSRSQLTAVHDIPASPTTQQSTSHPVLSAAITNQSASKVQACSLQTGDRNHVHNVAQAININSNTAATVSSLSNVAKEALEDTIACLSMQLKEANRRLESFNLTSNMNFGAPTSYIELIDVITKLSQSMSAAADAYKRFDDI